MNEEIINYAKGMNVDEKILDWLEKRVPKESSQTEIEHIIDYLVSDKTPKKLDRATYEQIKKKTKSWNKSLIKKGEHIKETKKDTKVVLDFKDGFKVVKLIGKKAYEREGYLMRHCVSSYFNSGEEIYSLRDKKNNPHATMSSSSNQIKGKGNGSINPKYVKYVVEFLEYKGMDVTDNEMKNIGYVNVEEIMKKEKDLVFPNLFKNKYFYKQDLEKVENRDRISLWQLFGIFNFNSKLDVKYNFNIEKSIKHFGNEFSIIKKNTSYNKVAMTDNNKIKCEENNVLAGDDNNEIIIGDKSIAVMGDNSKIKGKIGACFVLYERDNENNIIFGNFFKIDGKKIKEDTFYKLKNKKLMEIKNE